MRLGIGSTVWVFDYNMRARGHDMISRRADHWSATRISDETTRSWVALYRGSPFKIDKKTLRTSGLPTVGSVRVVFSQDDVVDDIYRHENAHKLAELVGRASAKTLRKIEALLKAGD